MVTSRCRCWTRPTLHPLILSSILTSGFSVFQTGSTAKASSVKTWWGNTCRLPATRPSSWCADLHRWSSLPATLTWIKSAMPTAAGSHFRHRPSSCVFFFFPYPESIKAVISTVGIALNLNMTYLSCKRITAWTNSCMFGRRLWMCRGKWDVK